MNTVEQNTVEQRAHAAQCAESTRSVELEHGQSITLGGASVKVVYGGVWLVGTHRADDYLVGSDDGAVYVTPGATISAIGKTRVDVVDVNCAALARCWWFRLRTLLGWRAPRPRVDAAAEEA